MTGIVESCGKRRKRLMIARGRAEKREFGKEEEEEEENESF